MTKWLQNLSIFENLDDHFYSFLKVGAKTGMSLALVCFFCASVHGQETQAPEIEVSGTVTDAQGQPIPGATVILRGTNRGTATNLDGNYTLLVPSDGVLIYSSVGYIIVEEEIEGRTTINVELAESVAELDDLIVTGYTAQRRADITGSVASVNVESLARHTSSSVLQRLDGQVAGVTVNTSGSPGARSTVRIRGISSFQNNDPLYIIDGTPIQDDFANWLNPNDIESIQVLKDASAASIYGSRANNGVIIIETKKGQRGAPEVSVNLRSGVATPVGGYDDFLILDALEYHEVVRRSHLNAGLEVPRNIYGDPDNPSIPNYIWPNDGVNQTQTVDEDTYSFPRNLIMPGSAGTNWWDAVFGPAFVSDFNLGVAGGGDEHRYNITFNYFDQEGTAAHNRFQRGTIRVNTEFDIGRLTIGENISLSLDEGFGGMPGGPGGFAEDGIIGKNVLMQPVVPVRDIAGNFASAKAPGLGNHSNPLKAAWGNRDDISRNTRIVGNAFARANLSEQFVFNSRLGFNLGEGSSRWFNPISPEDSEPDFINSIGESNNVFTDWTWTNTLTYVESFADNHNFNVLAGQEVSQNSNRWISASMADLISTDLNARFIQDAIGDPGTKNVNSLGGESSLFSWFGKIDYNYAQRYHISFTLRRDGSSRMGPENRWGTFPAASFGWRLSNEAFMRDSDFFTNLMIRFGYGITGNQQIPTGRIFDQFGGSTGTSFYDITGSGSNIRAGFRNTALGNPNLRWEENESVNLGVDTEFVEGRVHLTFDVYQRNVDNLLFDPPLPATAGRANPPIQNVGEMRNRGFDFTVGYRATVSPDLSWSVNFNGGHYRNEIIRIDGEQDFFTGPIGGRGGTISRNIVGQPIGAFYGRVADGIFMNWDEVDAHATQDGAAPGRIRFADINGDGQITGEDRTVIGSPHPDFTGGLDISVRWRNWDFNTSFFGSFGNDIFNVQKEFYVFRLFNSNVTRDMLTDAAVLNIDGPTTVDGQRVAGAEVTNPDARFPRLDENDVFSPEFSSLYVEDGSYVRMRNLQIGYSVPPGLVPGMRNMRIYIMGENLFTITGYSSIDPSLPASNVSGPAGDVRDQTFGVDRGVFPSNRTFSIGISAAF